MKRLALVLFILLLGWRSDAQNLQPPDMYFSINLSALSDSSPESAPPGVAIYNRIKPPIWPGMPTYTNRLEIYLNWVATPLETWIYEKQTNGSLKPVIQITNLFEDWNGGSYQSQQLTLDTNQIHSLITSNWFVAVDFGTSNYLGNITPQYNYANGPKAMMIFPPLPSGYPTYSYRLIAPDNQKVKFVLDGSHCVDPFYLPMNYQWQGRKGYYLDGPLAFTSTNMMMTNVFKLGLYTVSLQARDIIHDGQPDFFAVEVRTAEQAIKELISNLKGADMLPGQKTALINLLSRAAEAFNQEQMVKGCQWLEKYKRLVKFFHFNVRMTAVLLNSAQEIIDAVKPTANRAPRREVE